MMQIITKQNNITRHKGGRKITERKLNGDITDDDWKYQFLDYQQMVTNSKAMHDQMDITEDGTSKSNNNEVRDN